MINPDTIQKIFDAADIYQVVSDFVNLKKRGVNYVGCCPFHNEKTGSFTVSPAKGIYKCFGCGKAGNAVNFIMEHEQMSYVEALRFLAARYNITIEEKELTEEEKKEKGERESMLVVTAFAQEFFVDRLLHTDEGKSVGLGYLHKRGLDDAAIEKFGIGYSPEKWDALTQLAQEKGYKEEYLLKTGLTIPSDKGGFDRFRARVIFPIRDIGGKIIGFGGRIMTGDKKSAKYLNSPESAIYHKSRTLYGIYFAKRSIVQQDRCYLVEGYLDVISFHRKGIENTVASSGTALTVEQIRLVRRLTPNITIIYDGDPAGIKASLRGIDLVLEEGMNVRVLLLPEGEDPDSFSQSRTPEELQEYIRNNETDFISFKTKLLLNQAGNDPIERARLIKEVVQSISLIPDAITRSVYIREAAHLMQSEESELYNEVARIRTGKNTTEQRRPFDDRSGYREPAPVLSPVPAVKTDEGCGTEEQMLIRYLLLFGGIELYEESQGGEKRSVSVGGYIIRELAEDDLELFDPELLSIQKEYGLHYHSPGFIPAKFFIGHPDPRISGRAADILSEPYKLSKWWSERGSFLPGEELLLMELLPKVVDNYKMRRVELMVREADSKILELQTEGDTEEILAWIKRKSTLNRIRAKLNEKLGRTGIR